MYGKINRLSIKNRLKFALLQKIKEEYISYWKIRSHESSKLSFYKQIASDYKMANYLTTIRQRKYKIGLTKLRVSAHDLKIETGRYTNLPRDKRLCNVCNVLEDEYHFLDDCKSNNAFRIQLMQDINLTNTGITKPSELIYIPHS